MASQRRARISGSAHVLAWDADARARTSGSVHMWRIASLRAWLRAFAIFVRLRDKKKAPIGGGAFLVDQNNHCTNYGFGSSNWFAKLRRRRLDKHELGHPRREAAL